MMENTCVQNSLLISASWCSSSVFSVWSPFSIYSSSYSLQNFATVIKVIVSIVFKIFSNGIDVIKYPLEFKSIVCSLHLNLKTKKQRIFWCIAGMDSAHNWDAACRKPKGPSAIVCPPVSLYFHLSLICM